MENNEESIWENYKKPVERPSHDPNENMKFVNENGTVVDLSTALQDEAEQFPGSKGRSFKVIFDKDYDEFRKFKGRAIMFGTSGNGEANQSFDKIWEKQ